MGFITNVLTIIVLVCGAIMWGLRKSNKKLALKAGLVFIAGLLLIGAIGSGDDDEDIATSIEAQNESLAVENSGADITETSNETEVESYEAGVKKEIVNLQEDLIFGEMTIELKNAEYYTENGKDLVDVSFRWTNQSGEDDKPFFSIMIYEAFQNGEPLEEVSGLMNNPTFTGSGYYYKADNLISTPLTFVYEINKDEPIELRFTPTNEFEDTTSYVIEK